LDGHRSNDFGIYVYATSDARATWRQITAGLPDNNGIINVIASTRRTPDLLFAGASTGCSSSFNRGASCRGSR